MTFLEACWRGKEPSPRMRPAAAAAYGLLRAEAEHIVCLWALKKVTLWVISNSRQSFRLFLILFLLEKVLPKPRQLSWPVTPQQGGGIVLGLGEAQGDWSILGSSGAPGCLKIPCWASGTGRAPQSQAHPGEREGSPQDTWQDLHSWRTASGFMSHSNNSFLQLGLRLEIQRRCLQP